MWQYRTNTCIYFVPETHLFGVQIVQDGLDIGPGVGDVLSQHRLVQRLGSVVVDVTHGNVRVGVQRLFAVRVAAVLWLVCCT